VTTPDDAARLAAAADHWQAETLEPARTALGERKARFETDSGIPIKALYTPLDLPDTSTSTRSASPASFPSRAAPIRTCT
jgi:methylmalonyl-CoA mutase N-terminal domain/subunit